MNAGMLEKDYENVQFEVSMGNYGNMFDDTLSTVATDKIGTVFNGKQSIYCTSHMFNSHSPIQFGKWL